MLLNFCMCLHAVQPRFRSSASRLIEEQSLEMNVSVVSAVLRLFFPRKPREHLTTLKSILHPKAQLHAVRIRDKLSKSGAVQEGKEAGKEAGKEPVLPASVEIKEILGLPSASQMLKECLIECNFLARICCILL